MGNWLRTLAWRVCRRLWHIGGSLLPSGIREWVLLRAFQLRDRAPRAKKASYEEAEGKPGINIIGFFSQPTGLGQSVRGIYSSMEDSPVPLRRIDCSTGKELLSPENLQAENDRYRVNLWYLNGFELFLAMRAFGFSRVTANKNVCYWYWELEKLPLFWRPSLDYISEIWAASAFNAECFRKAAPAGVIVRQIPPTVTVAPVYKDWRSYFSLPADRILVLVLFDFGSVAERKNPGAAIEMLHAFRRQYGDRDFFLVVKTRNMDEFTTEKRELLAKLSGMDYKIINATLERDEVVGLYQACDVVVSLHRSEGFGLVPAEAMALGKAVIATAWSAPTDFMTAENSWPIPFRLIRNPRRCGPYPKGALWADADITAAARALKEIIDNPELRRARGEKARETIARMYSPQATRTAIETVFSEWDKGI